MFKAGGSGFEDDKTQAEPHDDPRQAAFKYGASSNAARSSFYAAKGDSNAGYVADEHVHQYPTKASR
jgi:hypothetical protein